MPVRRLLLPLPPVVDPESGVGMRTDAPRPLLPFEARGVLARVSGASFSLSEVVERVGLNTE